MNDFIFVFLIFILPALFMFGLALYYLFIIRGVRREIAQAKKLVGAPPKLLLQESAGIDDPPRGLLALPSSLPGLGLNDMRNDYEKIDFSSFKDVYHTWLLE